MLIVGPSALILIIYYNRAVAPLFQPKLAQTHQVQRCAVKSGGKVSKM